MNNLRAAALSLKGTDIFAASDSWLPEIIVRDPHSQFRRLRERYGPVIMRQGEGSDFDGFDVAALFLLDKSVPHYLILGFDAAAEVFRKSETFIQGYGKTFETLFGATVATINPPEQRPLKVFMQKIFNREQVNVWAETIVRPTLEQLVEHMVENGRRADIVQEVLSPLPFMMICQIIGTGLDRFRELAYAARDLMNVKNWAAALAASQYLETFFRDLIAERRHSPQNDLVSRLVDAEIGDGRRLSDQDVINFLRNLFPAGMDTTHRLMANMTLALLKNADVLNRLRSSREAVPAAVEEAIRWEGPASLAPRLAAHDTELCGTRIAAGSPVIIVQAAANRDPTRWERPDEFNPFRVQLPHIAFAGGAHVCLGNALARKESVMWLNMWFDLLPEMRIDPAVDPESLSPLGVTLRSPPSLPVVY